MDSLRILQRPHWIRSVVHEGNAGWHCSGGNGSYRFEVCHVPPGWGRLRKRLYTGVCLTIDVICPDFAIITAVTFLAGAQESTLVPEGADKTKFAQFEGG